jgi:hypothetical protein
MWLSILIKLDEKWLAKYGRLLVSSPQFEVRHAILYRGSRRYQSNAVHVLPKAICSQMSAPNRISLTTCENQ